MKKLKFPKVFKHRHLKVKVKKVKKSTLRNKADALFSKHIRSFGGCQAMTYEDVRCDGVLQCAHLTTRGNMRLRFDENNAICMCAGHHRFFTNHPLEWSLFLQTWHKNKYDYVMVHKNEKIKKTEDLYREVIERYT